MCKNSYNIGIDHPILLGHVHTAHTYSTLTIHDYMCVYCSCRKKKLLPVDYFHGDSKILIQAYDSFTTSIQFQYTRSFITSVNSDKLTWLVLGTLRHMNIQL